MHRAGYSGLRTMLSTLLALTLGSLYVGCGGDSRSPNTSPPPPATTAAVPSANNPHQASEFSTPDSCQSCHPMQYEEWQGSVMHYGAISPVFNALEITMEKLTAGGFAPNGQQPGFCVQCHSPTAVKNKELPDYTDALSAEPVAKSFSAISQEGLSCDFCHTVTGPDFQKSLLADGIANLSLQFEPSQVKQGPIMDPVENIAHTSQGSSYLSSAEFCGSCHDVRIPVPDAITGEPFQRLENLFTEWQEGPYNSASNPHGKVITCQDCHMSLYPLSEPGVYPTTPIAVLDGVVTPPRKHALHAFTAVSKPLMDDPRFPSTDTTAKDPYGYPLGQQQRREQMLRAACTLTLDGTPATLPAGATEIPIRVVVTNVGAGHRVPAGFSQERQVWVELVVRDDVGVIYESGTLHDKAHPETGELAPDGITDDEDLEDRHYIIDLQSFDTQYEAGPDVNQRPAGVNLGLMNFQNEFARIRADGSWEPVLNPLLADHMDNSHSLDMLTPKVVPYDIPVPARGIQGNIRVSVRLRYRAFPPEFLRFLAAREPDLVSEDTIDRNTVVDMASAETVLVVGQ